MIFDKGVTKMRGRHAVLVIHGFASGTWAHEYLVNYLNYDSHLDVYTFTLPGHDQAQLKQVKYQDWVLTCTKEIEKLREKYQQIYVVGHSMGGVLATYMASKYPEVKKLVLLAPAFYYLNLDQNKKDLMKVLKRETKLQDEPYATAMDKLFKVAPTMVIQFIKLINKYKNTASAVTCETLIIYGEADELVPLKSVEYAYTTIPAAKKYLFKIKDARHNMLIGDKKEEVSEKIRIFLRGGFKWKLLQRLNK